MINFLLSLKMYNGNKDVKDVYYDIFVSKQKY